MDRDKIPKEKSRNAASKKNKSINLRIHSLESLVSTAVASADHPRIDGVKRLVWRYRLGLAAGGV